MQDLLQNFPLAINVRVRIKFWQNAHVRAMCVRPKFECANVRACEAKNHRNSQFAIFTFLLCPHFSLIFCVLGISYANLVVTRMEYRVVFFKKISYIVFQVNKID